MELTYQREMILPANCYALSEDEMVYIDGGEISIDLGKYSLVINPNAMLPAFKSYAVNMAINFAYVLGMGMTGAVITGVVKGYKDGLSLSQTADHYFGNMNTAGKVALAAVGVPLTSFYVYYQALQIYNTIVTIVDSFKEWRASRNAASAEAELAVAA